MRLSGFLAWLTWLVVHLFYLVGFQNRLLVVIRWSISFATRGRGARLITDPGNAEVPRRPTRYPAEAQMTSWAPGTCHDGLGHRGSAPPTAAVLTPHSWTVSVRASNGPAATFATTEHFNLRDRPRIRASHGLLRGFYLRLSRSSSHTSRLFEGTRPAAPGAWQLTLMTAGMVAVEVDGVDVVATCAGLVLEVARAWTRSRFQLPSERSSEPAPSRCGDTTTVARAGYAVQP